MPTLFDKDFGKYTPEELAAELGTKKAVEAATPPRESLTDFLVRAYAANPGTEFGPTGMQPGPKAEPARPPMDGGYTPVPPEMSVGEPARGAPAPAQAPVRGRGVSSKPMQEDPLAAKAAALAAAPPAAPAPVPAPVAAAPVAPKGPSPEDEMVAAQDESKRRMLLGMIPAFLSGFSSKGESLRKDLGAVMNSPVTDLLARRQFGHEQEKAQREREEYEKKKSLDDLNSQPSKIFQQILVHRGIPPELARQLPASSFSEVMNAENTLDAAKNQVAMREQAKAEMGSREGIADRNNKTQWSIARMNNDTELAKAAAKGGAKNSAEFLVDPGTPVGGEWVLGDIGIKPAEAEKFRGGLEAAQKLRDTIARMKPLMKDKTRLIPGTTARRTLDSMASKLKLSDKEKENLGAISATDMGLLDDLIGNPSGWDPTGSRAAQLDEFERSLVRDVDAAASVRHFRKRGAAQSASAGDRVRVVGPNGETGTMDAAELDQHPGWKQVQ